MKKRLIGMGIVVVLFLVLLFIPTKKLSTEAMNELIVKSTMLYADSLLKTESLSQQANSPYEEGSVYIKTLTEQRELVYELTKKLESEASKLANMSRGQVAAYDAQDITNIIDKAPPGKKIKTLAKELNISAEKAFKLLKMSQQQLTAEARDEAGDTFETLENTAKMIKDGCKVGLMIGGAVIAGPISTAGTLDKAAMLINGADLVLQIGEDVSNIALGYNNQVAAIFGDIRKITEPGAAIVGFAGLYNAGDSAINMINAFTYAFEATNDMIQEGKVMGIKLDKEKIEMSILDTTEVATRTQDNAIPANTDTIELMENITQLVETIKEEKTESVIEEKNIQTETTTEENNETTSDKNNESIIGQRTHTAGHITSIYTFTENELQLSATSKGEKLGNTLTMKYTYENGKGSRGEPSTPSYLTYELKNNTLYITNIYGQTQKYTKSNTPIENNNMIDNTKKSLAGTKWEIIDGSTHGFMEFTETEIQAGIMVNGEKMGNTVTMKYTYNDGKGYYGSDDPKTIQRVEITLKGDNLILTTKQGQTYEYHRIR